MSSDKNSSIFSKNNVLYSESAYSDAFNPKIILSEEKKTSVKKNKTKKETLNKLLTKKELNLKFPSYLDEIKKELDDEIEKLKELKDKIKKIEHVYQSDMLKIYKTKKTEPRVVESGFQKKYKLPDNMCKLINKPNNTELSVPELSKYIYNELKTRNLMYKENKRIFRVDDELSRVLNIPQTVNNYTTIDDKGFNYHNIQSILLKILKK